MRFDTWIDSVRHGPSIPAAAAVHLKVTGRPRTPAGSDAEEERTGGIAVTAQPTPNAGQTTLQSELLFATPIFAQQWHDCEELNAHLRDHFLSREAAEAKADRRYSNVGGWHSPIDLQESWDPRVRLVLERCRSLAELATQRLLDEEDAGREPKFRVCAWANVSREGDYNVPHVHEMAWAAVYYVSVPPACIDDRTGALELMDPRSAIAMPDLVGRFFATRRVIHPVPGLMVLFPGTLMHFVHPFRGAGERISIACDLQFDGFR